MPFAILPQQTEFGIKVAILVSLTVICAVAPFIETAIRRHRERDDQASEVPAGGPLRPWPARLATMTRRPAVAAALIIAVAAPIDTAALSDNQQVILIEQGQVGEANAQ